MSILNALFSFAKGKEEQRVAKEASQHELFKADDERIAGQRAENRLTEELFSALASQKVGIVANGIDLSSPLAQNILKSTIKTGERETRKIKSDTVRADQARRARSRGLLKAGKFARIAGFVGGVSEIQKTISQAGSRG